MNAALRARIAALGCELTPAVVQATQAIFLETLPPLDAATKVTRDLAYGDHERHRLDLFVQDGADAGSRGAPVLVFVHGGGFIMGDKRSPTTPFYDNIGDFAARSGMVGVTVNYRLAPASPWPAGPEDLGRIVAWLRQNVAQHGGDPDRIILMGQSAGAVHVASYVAHKNFHPPDGLGIAGAIMLSCKYDVAAAQVDPFHTAYYGADAAAYAAASSTQGLIETSIPWLASVSEYDVPDFQKQSAAFVAAYGAAKRAYPRLHYLAGHNHMSPAVSIGTPGSDVAALIADFVAAVTA